MRASLWCSVCLYLLSCWAWLLHLIPMRLGRMPMSRRSERLRRSRFLAGVSRRLHRLRLPPLLRQRLRPMQGRRRRLLRPRLRLRFGVSLPLPLLRSRPILGCRRRSQWRPLLFLRTSLLLPRPLLCAGLAPFQHALVCGWTGPGGKACRFAGSMSGPLRTICALFIRAIWVLAARNNDVLRFFHCFFRLLPPGFVPDSSEPGLGRGSPRPGSLGGRRLSLQLFGIARLSRLWFRPLTD